MTTQLRPTMENLGKWALSHDDEDVALDAAFQLADRDASSKNFAEFVKRWIPAGEMTPILFDRFADAWVKNEGEKAVAQMGREVPIPDDLKDSPSAQ